MLACLSDAVDHMPKQTQNEKRESDGAGKQGKASQ
jgi:hypothetical protein